MAGAMVCSFRKKVLDSVTLLPYGLVILHTCALQHLWRPSLMKGASGVLSRRLKRERR